MGQYVLLLTAPTVMSDGTTQSAGTAVTEFVWDGIAQYTPPRGTSIAPYTGQTVFVPAQPPPTIITSLAFIQRFTSAEQTTLIAANPLWAIMIAAAGFIDVTDQLLLTNIAAAVEAALLTQSRSNQILNLAVPSP